VAGQAAGALLDPDARNDKRPKAAEIAKREPKQYRALARGYCDGMIREPGEVFATKADQGYWMEPVGKASKKDARVQEAVSDLQAAMKDDPSLESFSLEALQAEALRLGLTDATGLSKDDLIVALRAAYVNEAQ
jgi:hypothetical protein